MFGRNSLKGTQKGDLMGDKTAIEWTDATWNPWQGCTKVSPGCKHCYMYTGKLRYGQDPAIVVRSKTTFRDPLKWTRPQRVFTCSWSDFFHEAADLWRPEAWDIIKQTPHLTYQILTKRPQRIPACLPPLWSSGWPNVWLGVSVENARYTSRIALLQRVPAVVRFLSVEPLLGPIPHMPLDGIHWVIVGGESGPRHRPIKREWVTDIREQCLTAGVPFFFKQWGGITPKSGGRHLDGRVWNQMPRMPLKQGGLFNSNGRPHDLVRPSPHTR